MSKRAWPGRHEVREPLPFLGRHRLPGSGRFGDATLVSSKFRFEIGSTFLQILDLLAPRDALEAIHHLRVVCSHKFRSPHAFYVEERQLGAFDAAGQSVVTGGQLFGTREDRGGLGGEFLGGETRGQRAAESLRWG